MNEEPAPKKTMINAFLAVLTVLLITGFMSVIAALFLLEIPTSNRETFVYMVGQLSGFASASIGFWYSSTYQSSKKTEALMKAEPIKEPV